MENEAQAMSLLGVFLYTIQIPIKLKEIIQGERTRNEASSLMIETENANRLLSGSLQSGRVTVRQISISIYSELHSSSGGNQFEQLILN